MHKSSFMVLILLIVLYSVWVWSVAATPPFADLEDWPKTDFSRHSVALAEFIEGGPRKDGIQSIDDPQFLSVHEAQKWLHEREPVVAFKDNAMAKAYPLQILMYHEIVNDQLGEKNITVTYCPLCNAAMVFNRQFRGELLEFGTTGKVHTSNLVMYDRQSESWWLQFTGEGVVGKHTGAQLELLPSQIVSFGQFMHAYPQGKVLSKETGFEKKYGLNPYTDYDSRPLPMPWFFRKPPDERLPAMERVLGVEVNQHVVAYPLSTLTEKPILQQEIVDQPVVVISRAGMASAVDKRTIHESRDTLTAAVYSRIVNNQQLEFEFSENIIKDIQTESTWNLFGEATSGPLVGQRLTKLDRGVYFAFVWLEFYPQSKIYTQ